MLEKLVDLVPTDYKAACKVAMKIFKHVGQQQFQTLAGVSHMNCKEGHPLEPSEYVYLIKSLRKAQHKVPYWIHRNNP